MANLMTPDDHRQHAAFYLTYTRIYLDTGVGSIFLLRNFLDNWFGHHMAAQEVSGFVTRTGRPRWFNKGDLDGGVARSTARNHFHFVSDEAAKIVDSGADKPLMKEHAIPVKVMYGLLKSYVQRFGSEEATLGVFLRQFYKVALVSKAEVKSIDAANDPDDDSKTLKAAMPIAFMTAWRKELNDVEKAGDLKAIGPLSWRVRYDVANIQPHTPSANQR